jgi:hypothetical protein
MPSWTGASAGPGQSLAVAMEHKSLDEMSDQELLLIVAAGEDEGGWDADVPPDATEH